MQEYVRKLRYPLLIVSGILAALGMVYPASCGALAWVALIPVALVLLIQKDKVRLGSLYLYGFVFYLVYYIMSYHWFISMFPMDFAGFDPATAAGIIALAVLGISAFQAILSAIMFLVFGLLCRTVLVRRFPIVAPLLMACLWVVNEWSQTIGWTGLPWARLYLSQCDLLPMAQSASLLGGLFVSFLIVAVNFAIAGAIALRKHRLSHALLGGCLLGGNLLFGLAAMDAMHGNALPWQIGFMVTALVTVILAAVYGLWRKLRTDTRLLRAFLCIGLTLCVLSSLSPVLGGYANEGTPVRAAALQGNLSSKDKWADDSGKRSFLVYEQLTEQAAEQGAKIIVWPETALAYHLFNASPDSQRYAPIHMVYDLAERTDTTVLVSTFVTTHYFDPEAELLSMNAVIVFYPDYTFDENIYTKRMLVPFGEYVPWRDFLVSIIPVLGEINMLDTDLGRGEHAVSVDTKTPGVSLGPIICFDSIYEEPVRRTVMEGAQIITLSTNDSWFSDSTAVYMHNNQSKFRAIENGRYLVRSANTGISSIIGPDGSVLGEQAALTTGMVVADVYARDVQTPYTQVGYLIVWISFALQILLLLAQFVYSIAKCCKCHRTKEKT